MTYENKIKKLLCGFTLVSAGALAYLAFKDLPTPTAFAAAGHQTAVVEVQPSEVPIDCPKVPPKTPEIPRAKVYDNVPFKAGEKAVYEATYGGMLAGYATLEARSPMIYNGVYHRVFHAEGKTGDWFSAIFVGLDKVEAYSRPWDFGISKFYLEQFEKGPFKSAYISHKWLEFKHNDCKVKEKTVRPGKPESFEDFPLSYGAIDALGVVYYMRTKDYKLGKTERAPVYTSEKNWWLEATPVAFETVEVAAGKFETVKLKLQTFLGKDLQQKGDVFVWLATKTPQRQLVQIQGEIKLGSVWLKLFTYQAGG